MDFKDKLINLSSFIEEQSKISTDVSVEYAQSLNLKIVNDEVASESIDLFVQPKNTALAFAILNS